MRVARLLLAVPAIAAVVAPTGGAALAATCPVGTAAADETAVVNLVNATRAKSGLARLKTRVTLRASARRHSAAMAATGQLAHQVQNGRLTWAPAGLAAGENVALAQNGGQAVQLMMDSPPHRQNMLGPQWRSIGVGAVSSCAGLFFTLEFLG